MTDSPKELNKSIDHQMIRVWDKLIRNYMVKLTQKKSSTIIQNMGKFSLGKNKKSLFVWENEIKSKVKGPVSLFLWQDNFDYFIHTFC